MDFSLMCRYTPAKDGLDYACRDGVSIPAGKWTPVPQSVKDRNDLIRNNGWSEAADRFQFRVPTSAEYAAFL